MSIDLYLAVVTSNNVTLSSDSGVTVRNPFRGGAVGVNVVNPFVVSSYDFGVDVPLPTTSGGSTGKPAVSEVKLVMPEDRNTSALLIQLCSGRAIASADLLLVRPGEGQTSVLKPFAGFGFGTDLLADLSFAGAAGDETAAQTLTFAPVTVSVGWADQRAGGAYGPFAFTTWDFRAQRQV